VKAISFGWTSAPLLAGEKTVTRRNWKPRYAESFKAGEQCWALDKVYFAGGKRIAVIELTEAPYLENTVRIPNKDWYFEGFDFMTKAELTVDGKRPFDFWRDWYVNPTDLYVVRFKVVRFEALP
jgi:hypothetical protein